VPFHLALICPAITSAWFAVLTASGIAPQANIGRSGSRPSTGTYIWSNNLNIGACAALATRGSVNTDVPVRAGPRQSRGGPIWA
jgi:hypothetical protein